MGHVNMMDDVLISQLPPSILRSALRSLVSQGSTVQKVFVDHVRRRLRESPPPYPSALELFPYDDVTSPVAANFLANTRCLFSSKMVQEALPYLIHFVRCISTANARWSANSSMEITLEKASADIIQAIQALKEIRPEPTPNLQLILLELQKVLLDCHTYTLSIAVQYPFLRARRQVDDVLLHLYPEMTGIHLNGSISPCLEVAVDQQSAAMVERFRLGRLSAPRLFNGLWQVSSAAWGSAPCYKQDAELLKMMRAGLVAADMADHYGDAELIYGAFRNRLYPEVGNDVITATKWCIFRPLDGPVTSAFVLTAVQERSRRLGGRIELLQFHWYDYGDKDYLSILEELVHITRSHPHLVASIGLCNFDAQHTEEACKHLLSRTGEVGIVTNQVQYSLIDSRPVFRMADVCKKYGVKLLTYGSFCGGFLSDRWLGQPSPDIYREASALTPSQRKYFDMIMTWGSWDDLQRLLRTLKVVADRHLVSISNVAVRWVLDHAEVGAVIVGTRLGLSSNIDDNLKVFSFKLSPEDIRAIEEVALRSKALALYKTIGDCGHEYRNMY